MELMSHCIAFTLQLNATELSSTCQQMRTSASNIYSEVADEFISLCTPKHVVSFFEPSDFFCVRVLNTAHMLRYSWELSEISVDLSLACESTS